MAVTATIADRPVKRAIVYSTGFALLWAVLAVARPATTFHLAPLLVAAAVPAVYRVQGGNSRSTGLWLVLAGSGLALLTTALLSVVGALDGPSLLPFGEATVESLVVTAVGSVIGLAVAIWPAAVTAG